MKQRNDAILIYSIYKEMIDLLQNNKSEFYQGLRDVLICLTGGMKIVFDSEDMDIFLEEEKIRQILGDELKKMALAVLKKVEEYAQEKRRYSIN